MFRFMSLVLTIFSLQAAQADPSFFPWSTNTMPTAQYSNNFGARGYSYFVPQNLPKGSPLVVILHGCFLTGEQMASGTGMNAYAEKMGFAVLYPEQGYGDNTWKCWNWFKPENLRRDDGELSIIVGMVKDMTKKFALDKNRVFVAGISAGGAMTANLLACYSDVFAGGMVHSGLEFGAAKTEQEAHQVMKPGPSQDLQESAQTAYACSPKRTRLVPMMVIHGESDPFVGTVNSDRTAEQFQRLNLLIAKGASLPTKMSNRKSRIEPTQQYNFAANVTDTYVGDTLAVKKVMVVGMGHGWSGGNPTAPYMEPRGVNASEIMLNFWLK